MPYLSGCLTIAIRSTRSSTRSGIRRGGRSWISSATVRQPVSELAAPLPISLPAVVQHLHVLQECGLVESEKVGRVRTCRVRPATMRSAEDWIAERRDEWERRLDRLGEYLAEDPEEKKETER